MNSLEKNEGQASCEFHENLNLLRQTYFFSGMPLESLKVFAYLCTRERFKEGEYVFRQNEDDAQAFYLIEGAASLERRENGNTRHIRSYKTGDLFDSNARKVYQSHPTIFGSYSENISSTGGANWNLGGKLPLATNRTMRRLSSESRCQPPVAQLNGLKTYSFVRK
jgi:hypothetical protein